MGFLFSETHYMYMTAYANLVTDPRDIYVHYYLCSISLTNSNCTRKFFFITHKQQCPRCSQTGLIHQEFNFMLNYIQWVKIIGKKKHEKKNLCPFSGLRWLEKKSIHEKKNLCQIFLKGLA